MYIKYEGKSIIIHNAVVVVFMLAALPFCAASLPVVFILLFMHKIDVAISIPSLLPCVNYGQSTFS
jgi:hypothetical protein